MRVWLSSYVPRLRLKDARAQRDTAGVGADDRGGERAAPGSSASEAGAAGLLTKAHSVPATRVVSPPQPGAAPCESTEERSTPCTRGVAACGCGAALELEEQSEPRTLCLCGCSKQSWHWAVWAGAWCVRCVCCGAQAR